ncbi:MAG: PilN domain-containing protein, partial [Rhodoferax sp.]|nr:PilN domain-containing protein [Rhodoferax sp.]
QDKERGTLRAVLESAKVSAGPERAALAQEQVVRKAELLQRQQVLAALHQGLHEPGRGHAARLSLVAQTIPAAAWVRSLQADDTLLALSGFTLAPETLNDWVGKLAVSELLQGQVLDTIKVERVAASALGTATASPAQWSFHLVSRVGSALAALPLLPASQAAAGGQP